MILTESDSSTDTDINDDEDDVILLLTESDIPGASLDGTDPTKLNIPQLKRWLACGGVLVSSGIAKGGPEWAFALPSVICAQPSLTIDKCLMNHCSYI